MDPVRAVKELNALKLAAEDEPLRIIGAPHENWKAKVEVVLEAALGPESKILSKFSRVEYWVGVYSDAPGARERNAEIFRQGLEEALGLIDAAIYQIDLAREANAIPPTAAPAAPDSFAPFELSEEQIGLLRVIWNEVIGKTPEPGR